MTEKGPDTLDRLWDDIHTGNPPIAAMLSAGHAAKRRNRRTVIAGAAAATALVLSGGALLTRGGTPTNGPFAPAAELAVRITYSPSAEATALNVTMGHAAWNEADDTLIYVSDRGWSGSCPPVGTATVFRDGVGLELRQPDNGDNPCTADARSVTATITGLTAPPTDIEVTEGDKVSTVPVAKGPYASTSDNGAMIGPATAKPGEVVALTFPTSMVRGTDYRLAINDNGNWVDRYQLGSTQEGWPSSSQKPSWRPIEDALPVADMGVGGEGPDFVTIPDTAQAGDYRICTANARKEACISIQIVADQADLEPSTAVGDPAVWSIPEGTQLTKSSTVFTVDVQRLGCNSGVTGKALAPTIEYTDSEVMLTFQVEADKDGGRCPSNNPVEYNVTLDEPLGNRTLADGQCSPGEAAANTSHCRPDGIRWEQDGTQ